MYRKYSVGFIVAILGLLTLLSITVSAHSGTLVGNATCQGYSGSLQIDTPAGTHITPSATAPIAAASSTRAPSPANSTPSATASGTYIRRLGETPTPSVVTRNGQPTVFQPTTGSPRSNERTLPWLLGGGIAAILIGAGYLWHTQRKERI